MTRHILCVAAALLLTCHISTAEIPDGYYSTLNGKSGEQLKTAIHQLLYNHKLVSSYNSLPDYFKVTDVYPGTQRWWDMYSPDPVYTYETPYGSKMNREHSFPKSWWGGQTSTPAYTDLFHLYPSEAEVNQKKSNYPLGEVAVVNYTNNLSKIGKPVIGQGGNAAQVFEPADEYKGDFARSYFYMVCTYQNLTWADKYMYMLEQNNYPTLKEWASDMLMRWHRDDQRSQKEIDRNEAVYGFQQNRNPFIDYPEIAEYLWGDKQGEKFTVPGAPEPAPDTTPTLQTPENGSMIEFGEVALGKSSEAPLLLRGHDLKGMFSVTVTGGEKGMFRLSFTYIDASRVNDENGYTCYITYRPTATGVHKATLTITGGGMKTDREIELRGECQAMPVLSKIMALPASDITSDSYTANWEAPEDETVDYYIVSRTRVGAGESVTEELMTEETSMVVTGFDESVSEFYSVQSVRLGERSPKSDDIVVNHSGISGTEADGDLGWVETEGGIRMVCGRDYRNVRIHDISGRLQQYLPSVSNYQEIMLAPGVYIITADGQASPLRVFVR